MTIVLPMEPSVQEMMKQGDLFPCADLPQPLSAAMRSDFVDDGWGSASAAVATVLPQERGRVLRRGRTKKGTVEALERRFRQERSTEISHLLQEALQLLDRQSFDIDPGSYATLLKSCTHADSLAAGQFIHQHILTNGYETDVFICNFLVEMYGNCGAIEEAQFIFDNLCDPNVFSWTILIATYVYNGLFHEAYKLFRLMCSKGEIPNKHTFSTILATCVKPTALEQGKSIYASAIHDGYDTDVVVGTALVSMYGKCGTATEAGLVFQKIVHHDVVSWNAMIAACVEHNNCEAALVLFHRMLQDGMEPNRVTFSSILGACDSHDCLAQGEMIHASVVRCGFRSDLVIMNALIDMYGKCGRPTNAQRVFDKLQCRDVVSWSAIINAHAQHPREALELLSRMLLSGSMPNEFTYATIITACVSLKALCQGQVVHHLIMESGLESNMVVATALLSMYGKCDHVEEACWVFDELQERDLVLWNAMLAVYSKHGCGREALASLPQMQQEGQKPDKITLICVLSACSRAGLVDEGSAVYAAMGRDFHVTPSLEHCGCMVDLLGRAALLEETEDFIESMPFKPNSVIWEIFSNSSRVYGGKYARKTSSDSHCSNDQDCC